MDTSINTVAEGFSVVDAGLGNPVGFTEFYKTHDIYGVSDAASWREENFQGHGQTVWKSKIESGYIDLDFLDSADYSAFRYVTLSRSSIGQVQYLVVQFNYSKIFLKKLAQRNRAGFAFIYEVVSTCNGNEDFGSIQIRTRENNAHNNEPGELLYSRTIK